MKKLSNTTVFVGVSGGVDSSVSLALLKKQGYNVVGVFIRTWQPDFIECTWRDERRDAMRVCAHLGVPFLECDAEQAYKEGVALYMISEYKAGRTPNPDVMCNREVKFGVFWEFARERGADFIATGHYAQNIGGPLARENTFPQSSLSLPSYARRAPTPVASQELSSLLRSTDISEKLFTLQRGIDNSKDQSYFLWTLTQEDLAHTLFPIGHLEKSEVRKLANKFDIPVADKKDSQGVCFLGPLDMKDFLKHYIENKEGNVLDTDDNIIGTHEGALLYTLGERHGFNIIKKTPNDKPYFVVAKDIVNNTLTVSTDKYVNLDKSNSHRSDLWEVKLGNVVARGDLFSSPTTKYTAQVRYHGEYLPVEVVDYNKDTQTMTVSFTNPDPTVAPGQSVVIYDGDTCLAGGIVL